MDRPDLSALVAHYQQALRLLDWRLVVEYAPDLAARDGSPVWGLCYPTPDAKVARILIRDPLTPPDGATPEQACAQVVETVVHELVHLHFAPFALTNPTAVVAEEQAVWALSEALVAARGTPQEGQIARAMLAIVPVSPAKTSAPKRRAGERKMDLTLDELIKVAKALGMDPGTPVADIMAKLQGKAPAVPEAEEPAPEAPPMEAAAPPPDDAPAADEEKAMARAVAALTGKPAGASVAEVERWRASHIQLESERAKVAADRAALEASERRALVAKLVTDCGEAPATAWADDTATKPAEPWATMPLEALRARVAKLSAQPRAKVVEAPKGGATGAHGLTERELEICKETGCEPATFAAIKARRTTNTTAQS